MPMKRYHEDVLQFDSQGQQLLGLLAQPHAAAARPESAKVAVIIVVGGPQYRVGSHRQFTLLARALASAGWPVLRFDYAGMGDSTGDALPHFEQGQADLGAAIDATLRHLPDVHKVVLWGLCDGASAAMLYLHHSRDARVQGLCLVNPWVRSSAGQARVQVRHYYTRRLLAPDFWRKLFLGGVGLQALRGLLKALREMRRPSNVGPTDGRAAPGDFRARMSLAAAEFDGPVLLALSGDDLTAREFIDETERDAKWRRLLQSAHCQRLDLPQADHTLSDPTHEAELHRATIAWLASHCGSRSQAPR